MYNRAESLAVAYWQQRTNFINQQFDILDKALSENRLSFKELVQVIRNDLPKKKEHTVQTNLNNCIESIESFENAIVHYIQKVPFENKPQDYNTLGEGYKHPMDTLYEYQENLVVVMKKRNLSDPEDSNYLLKQLDKVELSLTRVYNHMIQFTQNEIELVYPKALEIAAKYNTSPKQIVEPSSHEKEAVPNPHTLFKK